MTQLHVFAISDTATHGVLRLGALTVPCLLGKAGRTFRKREGDGKSPRGKWRLVSLYFRPDKKIGIKSQIASKRLKALDAWCDAVGHKDYNRQVRLPFAASHETLWRKDEAYDILAVTSHNRTPRIQGAGSAIFLHLIRQGASFTEGCIALRRRDLELILSRCSRQTYLVI